MLQNRPRILYYCQSLVGIGHLTASLAIINELLRGVDVDLIYGGIHYTRFPQEDGFRVLQLPTLLFNEAGELYPPGETQPVDVVWRQRQSCIGAFINKTYKGIVVEFYPFGRRRFKKEIRWLCQQVFQHSGRIPVLSQVREILVPTSIADEESILGIIDNEIHTVLVRGDANIVAFDETFSLAPQLRDRLIYGGYVSQASPTEWPQRQKKILVSQGGGNVGTHLLKAAIQAAALLPDYRFVIATGSTAADCDIAELQTLVVSTNVAITPFLADFRQQLLTSALSINMGGDNTLLDMIATRTPSLAYPYPGNSEQALRINKLAQQGWVTGLTENDLSPLALKKLISQCLIKPYPGHTINLNGAVNISNKICAVIAQVGQAVNTAPK